MKNCNKCGVEKPLTEYTKRSKKSRDGHCHTCKDCLKVYRKSLNYPDLYKRSGKNSYLKSRYGIDIKQYEEIMSSGICNVCGTNEGRMCLDHCHSTGIIRGCLCHKCNTALGLFNDDTEIMNKAIEYIKRYKNGN